MEKLYLNDMELVVGNLGVHPGKNEDTKAKEIRISAAIRNIKDYNSAIKFRDVKDGDKIIIVTKNMGFEFKKTYEITNTKDAEIEIYPDKFCDSVARLIFVCTLANEQEEASSL